MHCACIKFRGFAIANAQLTDSKYATKLYGEQAANGTAEEEDSDAGGDIEAEINKELADIRKPTVQPLFQSVKLDTQCCKQYLHSWCRLRVRLINVVVFFKTRAPVDPVSFVHKICQDTADGVQHKNCRFVKRLTPITGIEKANEKGLETVAERVLAPHFHGEENAEKKVRSTPSYADVRHVLTETNSLTSCETTVRDSTDYPEQQRLQER